MTDQQYSHFSDETIRRFLLGRLTALEQSEFEQQLFTSSDLEARVRLAEIALTDDYAGRRLGRADEEQFRKRFLVSADRERLYAVSQALSARFAPVAVENRPAAKLEWFNFRAPVWRYAFATLLLLLVFATVWKVTKQPRLITEGPRRIFFKPRPTPTQTPVEAHHPDQGSVAEHRESVTPLPQHAEAIAVWLDSRNSVRHPAIVKLTDPTATIHFQVLLPEPPAGDYRADIFTIAYQPVFSVDWLQSADGSKLQLSVPSSALKPGDYKVKFMQLGKDGREFVYYFRVE
jgi:hypothetical protein